MKTNLTLYALLIALAGCAVGPNYQKPAVKTVAHWSEPLVGGETNRSASLADWWKTFNDPELNSLVERAVKSNLDLHIAEARVREARAQYGVAAADLWPTVDSASSFKRIGMSKNLPTPKGFPRALSLYQAGFDASWELDVFGGTRRNTEAARAEVSGAEFGQRAALVTLLGEVANNYVEVRGLQRRLDITRENIKAQEDALAITQSRFTNGLTGDLDVKQSTTILATTRAEIPALETALQTAIHRLDVLLGQQPGALLAELSTSASFPVAAPEVPVGLPSELLLRRPDVQQAERELAAATARIGVATADLFPKFSLTGVAGLQSVSASDWFSSGSKFWALGPTVQWKIFDAGRICANIRVQNARQEQALAHYEQTVLQSFEDVENALVSYAKEQVRRRELATAVKSSQESLHRANELYANGLSNFINVLDAERSVYQAQDQFVQSDRNVSANLITLYKSLGGGWKTEGVEVASAR